MICTSKLTILPIWRLRPIVIWLFAWSRTIGHQLYELGNLELTLYIWELRFEDVRFIFRWDLKHLLSGSVTKTCHLKHNCCWLHYKKPPGKDGSNILVLIKQTLWVLECTVPNWGAAIYWHSSSLNHSWHVELSVWQALGQSAGVVCLR